MLRLSLLIFIAIPILGLSQDNKKLIQLNEVDFNAFPTEYGVTSKVFHYYYDIGFRRKRIDSLNEQQKVLCYHLICNGTIDNSGFYSILLETQREYNLAYAKALELIGDSTDRQIFEEILSVYNRYKKWFSKQNTPPALDPDSKKFNEKLYDRIDELQKKWYENHTTRENLFNEYLSKNKQYLVVKE